MKDILVIEQRGGKYKRKKRKGNKGEDQDCQFRFDRCFVFSIGMECFSFGVFRHAVSGLYYLYIYIQQT